MKLPCMVCKETPSEIVTCKTCLTCWRVSVTTPLQTLATWVCPRCKSDDDARSILDNEQWSHGFIKPIVRNTDNNSPCYYRSSASRNIASRRRGPEEASVDGRKRSKKTRVTMPSSSRMPPQDSDSDSNSDSPSDAWSWA